MINRYARKEMKDIWSEENKFAAFLKVEILSLEAWCQLGKIPKQDVEKIKQNANFDIKRISEIEEETKHDVVAFTRCVSEYLGEEKKWVHYGLTSTDVVDTANGYIFLQANKILLNDINKFMNVLKQNAIKYKETICIGRTHGIHADITSFGLKWALWYEEMKRNLERFTYATKQVEAGKISGAVGNFANIPPFVQDYVCEKLNIQSAAISTQILQRDRHANYMAAIALIGATMEKIATEIRHLQRTEVGEAEEPFKKGQKGSSAMPHKRNPITSENICGCARVLRGYMLTSFDNINLWHERDISHSSAERIIFPDATILLDYMLNRYGNLLSNLVVWPEKMKNNIMKTNGVIFSQRIMNMLIEKGLSREEAYDTIQPIAMESFETQKDFKTLLSANKKIKEFTNEQELNNCFTYEYYLKNVDTIFERIGIK